MWDSEVSPKVERSRNYGTELNHRCGEVSSLSPLLCPPLAPHTIILPPCACYIGYTYRILHGKFGRTVFLSCWHTSRNQKSEISDTKTAFPEIPYKAFSMCMLHTETFIIDSASLLFQIFFKCWNLQKMIATHRKTDLTKKAKNIHSRSVWWKLWWRLRY